MNPCKHCHTFTCGGKCAQKMYLSSKEMAFASIYGAGSNSFQQQPVFHSDHIAKNPIPEGLKGYTGAKCPECGNMTWKTGWHFAGCNFHLDPSDCPVPSHAECVAAKQDTGSSMMNLEAKIMKEFGIAKVTGDSKVEGSGIKGHNIVGAVMDEVSSFKPGSLDGTYVLGSQKDASQNGVYTTESAMPEKMPTYEHPKYYGQIRSYAAHHGVSRYEAWNQTCGVLSAQKGYGWKNPYDPTGPVPSLTSGGGPVWPDLFGMGVCGFGADCELCKQQSPAQTYAQKLYGQASETVSYTESDAQISYTSKKLFPDIAATEFAVKPPLPWSDPNSNPIADIKAMVQKFKSFGDTTENLKNKIAEKLQGFSNGDVLKYVREAYKGDPQTGQPTEASAIFFVQQMPDVVVYLLIQNKPKAPAYGSVGCGCDECKEYAKNFMLWKVATAIAKPAGAVGATPPVNASLKAMTEAFDAWVQADDEDVEVYVNYLSKAELSLITGIKPLVDPSNLTALRAKAAELLTEFLTDVDEDSEGEWLEAHYNKVHGAPDPSIVNVATGGTVVKGASLKIAKLDKNGKVIPDSYVDVPTAKISFAPESALPDYSLKASATSFLAGDYNVSNFNTVTAQKMSPDSFALMTGASVKNLKPGDQVIIQVTEEGQLVVPPGMTAVVIPK